MNMEGLEIGFAVHVFLVLIIKRLNLWKGPPKETVIEQVINYRNWELKSCSNWNFFVYISFLTTLSLDVCVDKNISFPSFVS